MNVLASAQFVDADTSKRILLQAQEQQHEDDRETDLLATGDDGQYVDEDEDDVSARKPKSTTAKAAQKAKALRAHVKTAKSESLTVSFARFSC
jgi:hypothetical protein